MFQDISELLRKVSHSSPSPAYVGQSLPPHNNTEAIIPMRTEFVSALLFSLNLLPAFGAENANPRDGYAGRAQYYWLPYANTPNFGQPNPIQPSIRMRIEGRQFSIPMDTGSRCLFLTADLLPAKLPPGGFQGQQILNSSGRVFKGTWVPMKVYFPDAVGNGGATGTAYSNTLVLVVNFLTANSVPASGATKPGTTFGTIRKTGTVKLVGGGRKTYRNGILSLVPGQVVSYSDNPGVLQSGANFGIGFNRTGSTASNRDNQRYDAFFNLSQMQAGSMVAGFIIKPTGVQLGLTQETTGFAYTNLVPTGNARVTGSPPDWQAPMGTIEYQHRTYWYGQVVIDTGISHGILTLPKQPRTGNNVDYPLTVNLLNSNGGVSYRINSKPGNILRPSADGYGASGIAWFAPLSGLFTENDYPYQSQFFNTGRNVLNAFEYLYDASNGYLGLKPNGYSVPEAKITFTPGLYPNPIAPIDPFVPIQPESQSFRAGEQITFQAEVRGNPAPDSYQWQLSSGVGQPWNDLADGATYQGVSSNTLKVNTTNVMDGHRFRLVAGSLLGTVKSNVATLTEN